MTRRRVPPAVIRHRPAAHVARLAALLGAVGLVALLLLGPAGAASAAPAPPVPDRTVGPAVTPGGGVVVTLDALAPRVIRPGGPDQLVVSGTVRNSGTMPVRDVGARVARGPALSAERDVARALGGADPTDDVRTPVAPVATTLAPGQQLPFTLNVPLTVGAGSLALDGPGVYPLLVTAGTATDAGRAGGARVLLPVLGLPASAPGRAAAALPTAPAGRAERVSVLYPVADRPRRLPVPPGATPLLVDDDLAASFAPGGRLHGLVDALGRSAPPGSPAAASVCVAVDADLVETAQAMSGGYGIRADGGTVPGTGADAARAWLALLRGEVQGRCVVALPYADADLLATSRGNLTDLTTYARTAGARRVADLLGVTPLADATWPAGGVLDERTLADLATGGARSVVVDGATLADRDGDPPVGAVADLAAAPGTSVVAVGTDPLLAGALGGVPAVVGAAGTSPAGTTAPLSVQDAIAALTMRASATAIAERAANGDTGGTEGTGGSVAEPVATALLAPPTRWGAGALDGAEASALLSTVGDLAGLGLVSPVDLGSLTGGGSGDAAVPAGTLTPAGSAAEQPASGPDDAAITQARDVRDEQRDLLAASAQDHAGSPTPAEFVDPLTGDLLRSLSAVDRYDPAARTAAVAAVGAQMDALRSAVRVVQPSGSYSLGSNDAPLLLTVDNRLPVAVNVAVSLEPTPGLRAAPIGVQEVPAYGSRQFQVGITVSRSGQFSVDAQAHTPGGEPLGPTSRLLLRSTAYGTITVWLTASAAVVLVILATVRIVRRVRAARTGRPEADPRTPGTTVDPRPLQRR